MWKLLFLALVVALIWKFYPAFSSFNPQDAKQNTLNNIKMEKTIFNVNERRAEMEKEAQDAMRN